jgi:hypothetical protein
MGLSRDEAHAQAPRSFDRVQTPTSLLPARTLYGRAKRHGVCRNLIRAWVAKFEAGEFDLEAEAASLINGSSAGKPSSWSF